MATTVLTQHTLGAPLNGTTLNANLQTIENSFADLGPYVISGLTVSAGAGLSASVAAGTASIGGRVTVSSPFVITGLVDASLNYLYMLNTGAGTSNLTGTAPANSVKLGTATTAAGVVASVAMGRTTGRQQFRQPQDLVPGGPASGTTSAGHPGSIDLSQWNATAAEGKTVFGVLPAGAIRLAQTTKTANYTATDSDTAIFGDTSGGAITITLPTAVGRAGRIFIIKKVLGGNNVTVQAAGVETIDGANTAVIATLYASLSIVSNGLGWWIW